jgi:transcriptional regulator with XRE-family HTH domain
MRQASMKAGLAPETISLILRRGPESHPRPDTLMAIAEALGGNLTYMMRLAGHLPPSPAEAEDAELRRKVNHIIEIFEGLPHDLQLKMADQIIVQAEATKVAFAAGKQVARSEMAELELEEM